MESPRRLSLGSRSLLPFACRGGPARLDTVLGRGNLDCRVQLLRVEAAGGKEPVRGQDLGPRLGSTRAQGAGKDTELGEQKGGCSSC